MKLISLGKIDKKFFLFLFLYIIISSLMFSIGLYIDNEENNKIENILLNRIINYSCFIFYILPEYIIKNKSSTSKQENDEKNINDYKNQIIYLQYNKPKIMNTKSYLYLLFLLSLNYIIDFGLDVCSVIYSENYKLFLNEFQIAICIFYFYLIFRILDKMTFYRHQYLSFLMIFFIDLIRFFFLIFLIKRINFDFPSDLLSLIPLIVIPAIRSFQFYLMKRYMQYKYLSPFFLIFLLGLVYVFISIILLPIFLNIDCGTKIKPLLCEIQDVSTLNVILNILSAILLTFVNFLWLKTIDTFTVYHILIYFSYDIFISDISDLIFNF